MLLRKGIVSEITEDLLVYFNSKNIEVNRDDVSLIIDSHVGLLADIIEEQAISIGIEDESD